MTLIRAERRAKKRMTAFVSRTVTRKATPSAKRRSDTNTNSSLSGHSEAPGKTAKVQSRLTANVSSAVGARPRNSTSPPSLSRAPPATHDTATGTLNATGMHPAAHTEHTATKQSQQTILTFSSPSVGSKIASAAPLDCSATAGAPTDPQSHGLASPDSDLSLIHISEPTRPY